MTAWRSKTERQAVLDEVCARRGWKAGGPYVDSRRTIEITCHCGHVMNVTLAQAERRGCRQCMIERRHAKTTARWEERKEWFGLVGDTPPHEGMVTVQCREGHRFEISATTAHWGPKIICWTCRAQNRLRTGT
jgi:hypothetical protein